MSLMMKKVKDLPGIANNRGNTTTSLNELERMLGSNLFNRMGKFK